MEHWSHKEHVLVLKPQEKRTDATSSDDELTDCRFCRRTISGPFYGCKECDYNLHKICPELQKTINHLDHPQHSLTIQKLRSSRRWMYRCTQCRYYTDMETVAQSQSIRNKCHRHPLIPIQLEIPFPCDICLKTEEGVSYKCTLCSFWVHQNCTLLLPDTVECSDHEHQLTLSHSIPDGYFENSNNRCDICHDIITRGKTIYCCSRCLFFAHAICAISSRDEDDVVDLNAVLLPVRKDWTSIISMIAGISKRADDITDNETDHYSHNHLLHLHNEGEGEGEGEGKISHDHVLHLHDGQANNLLFGKVCEACAQPISGPWYGCYRCDYFLHKCCIGLPKEISHPCHPQHDMKLFKQYPNRLGMFCCNFCFQVCNVYGYNCNKCDFTIDLKCASLYGRINHEAHKHTLSPKNVRNTECSACCIILGHVKCETCSFNLCFFCATLPPTVDHRYCKCHGFKLQYSPLKDYDKDYYCYLCEWPLQPKEWFYYCGNCDQFAHPRCLIRNAGDSNIKFGKRYDLPEHEHMLTLTRFTYEYSNCKICVMSLNKGFAVGFECSTCPYFKIHLQCVKSWREVKGGELLKYY